MAKGGKRIGAGVKEGSIRPHISQYWTEDEIRDFFRDMYKRAKKSDRIAVWCGDQLSGKAPQPLSNPDGTPLVISFDSTFKKQ
jgi:hypothetical protein